jgi:hypothetical protein
MAKLFSYLKKEAAPSRRTTKVAAAEEGGDSAIEAFCKAAAAPGIELAARFLRQRHEADEAIEKVAASDNFEEDFGGYVKIGQDMAIGYIAGLSKVAMEEAGEDADIEEARETLAAQIAEAIADELPDEALEDEEAMAEVVQAAEDSADVMIQEALGATEDEGYEDEE